MRKTMEKYRDILYMPRPALKHSRMPGEKRAAQFMPFAALAGYEDSIAETARLTCTHEELSADEREELDEVMGQLIGKEKEGITVEAEWFAEDRRKSGGKYVKTRGAYRGCDTAEGQLMIGREKIPFGLIRHLRIVGKADENYTEMR